MSHIYIYIMIRETLCDTGSGELWPGCPCRFVDTRWSQKWRLMLPVRLWQEATWPSRSRMAVSGCNRITPGRSATLIECCLNLMVTHSSILLYTLHLEECFTLLCAEHGRQEGMNSTKYMRQETWRNVRRKTWRNILRLVQNCYSYNMPLSVQDCIP